MTPVLVGLLLGVGLFCVWWSFWPVEESRQSGRRPGVRDRLQDEITQAGLFPIAYTIGTDFKPAARPDADTIIHWDRW